MVCALGWAVAQYNLVANACVITSGTVITYIQNVAKFVVRKLFGEEDRWPILLDI